EKAGAKIERWNVPEIDEAMKLTELHGSLASAESYHEYRQLVEGEEGRKIDPRVVHRIMQGAAMSANDLLYIQNTRRKTMGTLALALGRALLAMPTTPITAPKIAPLDADSELFHKVNLHALRNTAIGNFLGLCGLAIPNGRDRKGLPTSILFNAPVGQDDSLLGYGLEIDRVLPSGFDPTWRRI
ncbi:MAG: amidase family protein, partial [Hyphomicrobiales bacterium]